jgi:hypothetical protein
MPANVALRSRLLGLFTKSIAAANCFPHTLTVSKSGPGAGRSQGPSQGAYGVLLASPGPSAAYLQRGLTRCYMVHCSCQLHGVPRRGQPLKLPAPRSTGPQS